jgi:hypothetical protein
MQRHQLLGVYLHLHNALLLDEKFRALPGVLAVIQAEQAQIVLHHVCLDLNMDVHQGADVEAAGERGSENGCHVMRCDAIALQRSDTMSPQTRRTGSVSHSPPERRFYSG